jgi:hypothetical protein
MTTLPTATPSAADFGRLRALLARLGFAQADIDTAIGADVAARDRAAIADALRTFLRNLPHVADPCLPGAEKVEAESQIPAYQGK